MSTKTEEVKAREKEKKKNHLMLMKGRTIISIMRCPVFSVSNKDGREPRRVVIQEEGRKCPPACVVSVNKRTSVLDSGVMIHSQSISLHCCSPSETGCWTLSPPRPPHQISQVPGVSGMQEGYWGSETNTEGTQLCHDLTTYRRQQREREYKMM